MTRNAGSSADRIGFIGLGNMGRPMSNNLARAGCDLVVYDVAGTQDRAPAGAQAASDVAQVAAAATTVLLSLPDGDAVHAVVRAIAARSPRVTGAVVDLSTIGIEAAQETARLLDAEGIAYLDAPVSGGVAGAAAASLALMAAGARADFDRLDPLLAHIAANRFHVGDTPGQGQAMKLLNNFLSATASAATSEATLFGARHGLALSTMLDVLNASSGRNTATSDKFPRAVLPGTFDLGFAATLMAKDARLYREGVEAAGTPAAIAQVVAALCAEMADAMPDADFSQIYEFIGRRSAPV